MLMTTTESPTRALLYVPGAIQLDRSMREERTERYRTWHSSNLSTGWGWECLLCGAWNTGERSREAAIDQAATDHAHECHVLIGCYCVDPHLTAVMAARIGVKDSYPRERTAVLFRMAGGVRKYVPPAVDLGGTLFAGPEFGSGGYKWTF